MTDGDATIWCPRCARMIRAVVVARPRPVEFHLACPRCATRLGDWLEEAGLLYPEKKTRGKGK